MLLVSSLALAVTLEEAWSSAESNSVDLAMVRENTRQGETLTGKAWALVQPKLVLGGHYTINDKEISWDPDALITIPDELRDTLNIPDAEAIVFQKKQYFDGNISVIQPIFSGAAFPLLKGAQAAVKASREDEASARTQIRAGIARAFYSVAVTRDMELVAREAAENAGKHAALVQKQTEIGLAPPTAHLQAEIAQSKAKRQVAAAHEGVVIAESAFAKVTGLSADSAIELPAERALPYDSVDAASERAAAQRPEIAAAQHRAKAARMQKLATDLGWLPSLDSRFTYNYTENSGGFNDSPDMWQVVFTANWTLWDGGFRLAEERGAASVARQARYAVEKATDDATESIRRLWEARARSAEAFDLVRREHALAVENQRIAEAAYTAGVITFLELEDARLGVRAAAAAEVSERMNRDLAAIDLLAATGDL